MRELTRVKNSGRQEVQSARRDKAQVIVNGYVAPSGRATEPISCELLDSSQDYVVFGGKLRRHRGRGYRLISPASQSWLHKAGYTSDEIEASACHVVRQFLHDLKKLSNLLGLVVVGRHHRRNEWEGLEQMLPQLSNDPVWKWLHECTVRIFAPADYLIRWR